MKVKFDISEIYYATKQFRQYSNEIKEIRERLVTALQDMRERDWQGKAADKMCSILGDDWSLTVDRYCSMMQMLTDIMDDASRTYEHLLEEAKALRLEN